MDSETYTGGRVECLRSGVYRSDFPTDFNLNPNAFQSLIDNLETVIKFSVERDTEQDFNSIDNYEEVYQELKNALESLKTVKNPHKYESLPLIYHLDVAAMYPNIILTNRLQPVAVVNEKICSNCYYNSPENECKRELQW